MNRKLTGYKPLIILLVVLLLAAPVVGVGCGEEKGQLPAASPTGELSSTLVPNTDLDVYVYMKQDNPTTLPKDITGVPLDVAVESLAIWGIPMGDDFAFGGGLTLTNTDVATKIYAQVTPKEHTWTTLSGSTILFVQGSGAAAETLKTAISNKDFKYYDDQKSLKEVAALPDGGATKLAAVAIAKPSKTLLNRMMVIANIEASGMMNTILALVRLEVIVGGLYAPQQIDVAEIAKTMKQDGDIRELDGGILTLVKSGLPGFVVSPIVEQFLDRAGFAKTNLGELTLYQRFLNTANGKTIPVLVRVEGNRIFAAISGQESYAQTLITSIIR